MTQPCKVEPRPTRTEGDGRPTLGTAVVLAVQPRLWADAELIFGLVADLGAHTWLGDEVQALTVTAIGATWEGKREA